MEKVLPESVQTLHLSGPLSLHEWQQLFELAPFGIGVFDREFRCRGVNGIFTELSGLAQEDHLGKTLFDITPAQGPLLRLQLQQWLGDTPRAELDLGTVHVSRPGGPRRCSTSRQPRPPCCSPGSSNCSMAPPGPSWIWAASMSPAPAGRGAGR